MKHFDGTEDMPFIFDDGGRGRSGYKGIAGDCVCRAIAIASGKDYAVIYDSLHSNMKNQRGKRKGESPRSGVRTSSEWFKRYMRNLGFTWTSTMTIGSGCRVHLIKGELPMGRLVVALSKHYVAVIDGVVRDIYDPKRTSVVNENGVTRLAHRCVYGYWSFSA